MEYGKEGASMLESLGRFVCPRWMVSLQNIVSIFKRMCIAEWQRQDKDLGVPVGNNSWLVPLPKQRTQDGQKGGLQRRQLLRKWYRHRKYTF